ncbi:tRNA lysidine(34) synthetase TilS [Weissella viridescens]|uniref:tRNA(Ile)-lysidine synthase n=1 Tax=Weissella viridescens TaxID=1629 RepID=A0A3P2RDL2_WEIVI|nr:tRNA lysidine(34) synthetase TilS [Weissella viridescens]RRG17455.1 tRNA lysidine(34) synthetase TilS [Weissella viridescens]
MQDNKLNRQLIETVRTKQLFKASDHIVVAFSGGHDSLTLLNWLTQQYLPQALQPKVSALYVNHQLRDDAPAEAQFVREVFDTNPQLAETKIVTLEWDEVPTSAIEEQARDRRYAALVDFAQTIGANKIVTAHHATDQAETILYKLIRGGHIQQLQGMQPKVPLTETIELVRPFLGIAKGSLDTLLDKPLQQWITDSSNQDNRFARNRIRNRVMPELQQINQQASAHINESAEQLSGMQYLLEASLPQYFSALEAGTFDWSMPDAAITYVLQAWLNEQGLYQVKQRQLQQALQLMRNDSVAHGIIDLGKGWQLVREQAILALVSIGQES